MADQPTIVHIGENSPEQVAYKLTRDIAMVENRDISWKATSGCTLADRAWILSTYNECIRTVKGAKIY